MKARELAELLMQNPECEVRYQDVYQDAYGIYGDTMISECTPKNISVCEDMVYLHFEVLNTTVQGHDPEPIYPEQIDDESDYVDGYYENLYDIENNIDLEGFHKVEEAEREDYERLQEYFNFPEVEDRDYALERLILDLVCSDKEIQKEINRAIDRPEDYHVFWEQAVEFLLSWDSLFSLTAMLETFGLLDNDNSGYYCLFKAELKNVHHTLESC